MVQRTYRHHELVWLVFQALGSSLNQAHPDITNRRTPDSTWILRGTLLRPYNSTIDMRALASLQSSLSKKWTKCLSKIYGIERFQELPVQFFLWRHYAYAALSLGRDKMALGRDFTTVESAARWQPLSNFFAGLFAYSDHIRPTLPHLPNPY